MEHNKKPDAHQGDLSNLPPALAPLKERPQWTVWKWTLNGSGDWQKPPFQATAPDQHASTADPSTWATYEVALAAVQAGHADGISYVLTADDPFAAIDLDDCRNDDDHSIAPWAQHFLDKGKNSYSEVTPSGTGLRIWGMASGAKVNRKFSNVDGNGGAAEIFRSAAKALTISGLPIAGVHELGNVDKLVDWAVVWGERKAKEARAEQQRARGEGNGFNHSGGRYSIDEIDQIVREGAPAGTDRSGVFHSVVGHFIGVGWSTDQIIELFEKHPQGIAERYIGESRLRRPGTGWGRWSAAPRNSVTSAKDEDGADEEPPSAGGGAREDPEPENDWSKDAFTAAELKDMEFDPINVVVEGVIVEGLIPLGRQAQGGEILDGPRDMHGRHHQRHRAWRPHRGSGRRALLGSRR